MTKIPKPTCVNCKSENLVAIREVQVAGDVVELAKSTEIEIDSLAILAIDYLCNDCFTHSIRFD